MNSCTFIFIDINENKVTFNVKKPSTALRYIDFFKKVLENAKKMQYFFNINYDAFTIECHSNKKHVDINENISDDVQELEFRQKMKKTKLQIEPHSGITLDIPINDQDPPIDESCRLVFNDINGTRIVSEVKKPNRELRYIDVFEEFLNDAKKKGYFSKINNDIFTIECKSNNEPVKLHEYVHNDVQELEFRQKFKTVQDLLKDSKITKKQIDKHPEYTLNILENTNLNIPDFTNFIIKDYNKNTSELIELVDLTDNTASQFPLSLSESKDKNSPEESIKIIIQFLDFYNINVNKEEIRAVYQIIPQIDTVINLFLDKNSQTF